MQSSSFTYRNEQFDCFPRGRDLLFDPQPCVLASVRMTSGAAALAVATTMTTADGATIPLTSGGEEAGVESASRANAAAAATT